VTVRKRRRRVGRTRVRRKPGAAPGTFHKVEAPEVAPTRVLLMAFGPEGVDERDVRAITDLDGVAEAHPVNWIHVCGHSDLARFRELGDRFQLHPLALEDVVHTDQRAKVEMYGPWLHFVGRYARYSERFETEQVSLFVGRNIVLSFQESGEDLFSAIRERIRSGRPRLREGKPGYLAYALIDNLVDSYFPVMEAMRDRIEQEEDEVLHNPSTDDLARIQEIRVDLLALRRAAWGHRDALTELVRDWQTKLEEDLSAYLRDVQDHVLQIVEISEIYREMGADLMSVYMSQVNNRMNEIMKVLTIISTIFMPLSFIAGVYGMNFHPEVSRWNMPELLWPLGYPFALTLMAITAAGLVAYIVSKGWLK